MHQADHDIDRKIVYLTLALFVFTGFFAGLGAGPLFDVDEGAFSEATREMMVRKNYLTTYLNGALRFDKPILIYWLQLLSVRSFGLTEFAFRLPSAIAAGVWTVATFLFVRKERNEQEALLAAAMMTLSLQVSIIAKAAIADALLNCCLAVSMFSIYRYWQKKNTASIYLAFAAMGLGVLTKGPIALLIPLPVSFVFFLLQHDLKSWFRALLNPGAIVLFLAIVLPWYTLEYLDQGSAFIEGFFMKHNVGRFSSSLEGHSGSLFYYIPVIIAGLMPSTGLLFLALANMRKLLADPLNLFGLLWAGFVFVLFSLSGTKLPHYMIYGYTPLFIMMARAFAWHRRTWILLFWPAATLLLFAALPAVIERLLPTLTNLFIREQLKGLLELMTERRFCLVTVVAAVLTLLPLAASKLPSWSRFILGGSVFMATTTFFIMPMVADVMQVPVKEAALLAKQRGWKIVMWEVYYPSFLLYSESLAEQREPRPGEIFLTTVDYAGNHEKIELLYMKYGIMLAKMAETK